MIVGCPKESKIREYRVGITPSSAREIVGKGHKVIVQSNAGVGIGAEDADYVLAGAEVVRSLEDVFARSDLIVKVKEPLSDERKLLKSNHVLFTFLHLAPDREQTADLVSSRATCIAYETVTSSQGGLPLLAPMSEVAGRMAVQAGARLLEKPQGGPGILIGGVPGVAPARVLVLGGGVVGGHATQIALGMGGDTVVLDRNPDVLRRLAAQFGPALKTVASNKEAIDFHLMQADLIIGSVLLAGGSAPKLISRTHLRKMKPGCVIVDVAIDQGGCAETSRVTTHDEPTYVIDGVIHYCVANMPGGVPKTSTDALNNVTLPFVLALADKGWHRALKDDAHLRNGLNVWNGKVTCKPVAEALGYPYTDAAFALAS